MEKQANRDKGLSVEHAGETFYTSNMFTSPVQSESANEDTVEHIVTYPIIRAEWLERRMSAARQEADAISKRPELLGVLTVKFNITTIGGLLSIPAKSIAQLCRLNNVEFTEAIYTDIRVELQSKYKLIWKKPTYNKKES